MEWITGKYRVRPMLIIILVGSFLAFFGLVPAFKLIGKSITNIEAGEKTVSCNAQETDELVIAKAELERSSQLDAVGEKRDLMNALNRLSKFSYCENTLMLSLKAAERLHGYSNHNIERINIADALMHSLENAESGFGLDSNTRMSAIILIESYMNTIKENKVSVYADQIAKYRQTAWSLSERFRELGYDEKAQFWSEEFVRYKVLGKIPPFLEKYERAEQAVSNALQKVAER